MTTTRPHVTVCVCTFQRPSLLASLLRALSQQVTGERFTYSVVVVDNDAAQSARQTVAEAAASASRCEITYRLEPRQNIAMARNAAVAGATGDLIAMIDDDERPPDDWLLRLFETRNTYGADGVLGPVVPLFDERAPRWVVAGGFYHRRRHPSGHRLTWSECRTGNVLVARSVFDQMETPFNPVFLSGEDQDFFKRAMGQARTFVWCDEAVVQEVVPPARWRRGFLVKRAVVRGAFSRRQHSGSPWPVLQSMVAAPAYLAVLPVALIFGQSAFMSCAFKCSYHCGRLFAFLAP